MLNKLMLNKLGYKFLILFVLGFSLFATHDANAAFGGTNVLPDQIAGDDAGFIYRFTVSLSDFSYQAYKAEAQTTVVETFGGTRDLVIEMCLNNTGAWASGLCYTLLTTNANFVGEFWAVSEELPIGTLDYFTFAVFQVRGHNHRTRSTFTVFGRKVTATMNGPVSVPAGQTFAVGWFTNETSQNPTLTAPPYCSPGSGSVAGTSQTLCTAPNGGSADFSITATGPGQQPVVTANWSVAIGATQPTCQDPNANNYGGTLPCTYPPAGGGGGSCPGDCAQYINQNVPTTVPPGQPFAVSITMRNIGTTTWTSNYRLGSQSPQDNFTWGLSRVGVPYDVAPGQNVTFSFSPTAPGANGQYNFQWRMVNEGVQWFGDYTPLVVITVDPGAPVGGGGSGPPPGNPPGIPMGTATLQCFGPNDGGFNNGPCFFDPAAGQSVQVRASWNNQTRCVATEGAAYSQPAGTPGYVEHWTAQYNVDVPPYSGFGSYDGGRTDVYAPPTDRLYFVNCEDLASAPGAEIWNAASVWVKVAQAPFDPPTNLVVTNDTCTKLDLNWTDTTGETQYRILRSTTPGTEVQVAVVGANVTTYQDDTPPLVVNTRYYYKIEAFRGSDGATSYSNEANALNLPCISNVSTSKKTIFEVNGDPYVPTMTIENGDIITFRISITNAPNASDATISYVCEVLPAVFDPTYGTNGIDNISHSGGSWNPPTYNDPDPSKCNGDTRFNISGNLPGGTTWTITFDAKLNSGSTSKYDSLTNTAVIKYTDGSGNCPCTKTVTVPPILFSTSRPNEPNFREVAP